MKKLFALFLAASAFSCTSPGYVINGHVSDDSLIDHEVFLKDAFAGGNIDTAVIQSDGTFRFEGNADVPFIAGISVEYSEVQTALVVENGKIALDIDLVDGNYIPAVSGTPMNEKISSFDREMGNLRNTLMSEMESLGKDITLSAEEIQAKQDASVYKFQKSFTSKCEEVFSANQDNVVGLFVLLNWTSMDSHLNVDSLANLGGDVIRQNPVVQNLIEAQHRVEATAPGKPYVDLTGVDANGNMVSLSDFVGKGKLVLVDFWASWCVPCKGEIPNLAMVLKKYYGKVSVVGLNVWDKMEDFKKACAEEKITWPQIVDPSSQSFTQQYGVEGIPQILLIDADGTIIARDLRGDQIFEAIDKALWK